MYILFHAGMDINTARNYKNSEPLRCSSKRINNKNQLSFAEVLERAVGVDDDYTLDL